MIIFNQEKALVGAFSMIVETDGSFAALVLMLRAEGACQNGNVLQIFGVGETVAAGADWWGAEPPTQHTPERESEQESCDVSRVTLC